MFMDAPQGVTPPTEDVVAAQGGGDQDVSVEELKAQLQAKDEEIAKLRSKDISFKKVQDGAERKVAEVEAEWSQKFQALESKLVELSGSQVKETREAMLAQLVGDDISLKERVVAEYNRLSDPDDSPSTVHKKITDAYLLATGTRITSPFVSTPGATYAPLETAQKRENFADTEKGKSLAAKLNLNLSPNKPQ